MKNNSDKVYEKFKNYDFSDAKHVSEVPHLAKLQAEAGGKAHVTMRIDNEVLAVFKARAEMMGGKYQTLMNEALKQFAQGLTLADVVREAVRESLNGCGGLRSMPATSSPPHKKAKKPSSERARHR